jgi:predicted nuclease with TOPRIM domain
MSVYPIVSDEIIAKMDINQMAGELRRLNEYIEWRRERVTDLTATETEPGEYRAEFVRLSGELSQLRSHKGTAETHSKILGLENQIGQLLTQLKNKDEHISALIQESKDLTRKLKATHRKVLQSKTAKVPVHKALEYRAMETYLL